MNLDLLKESHPAFGNGEEPSWLQGARAKALVELESTGFPGPRTEEWRYSNPKHILNVNWTLGASTASLAEAWKDPNAAVELVFVNGHFCPEQSRGFVGGKITNLKSLLGDKNAEKILARFTHEDSEAFSALNLAFLQDGAWISIDRNQTLEGLIHVLHVTDSSSDTTSQIRNVIALGTHASARVLETYVSNTNDCLTNVVTEIQLADGAELEHTLWQRGTAGSKIGRIHVHQKRDSAYDGHSFWLGSTWVRNDIHVELSEEGAACSLNGLYLLGGKQHLDNHTVIDHQAPHCVSRELYKGVLGGKSTGVYNGMVKVQQIAQKTDSEQANHNLLLSDGADINTKPELEIYADDVKCAHGTTVGQLDQQALMYMRMRGIPKSEAIHILTRAFAQELLEEIEDEVVRGRIEEEVFQRLAQIRDDD